MTAPQSRQVKIRFQSLVLKVPGDVVHSIAKRLPQSRLISEATIGRRATIQEKVPGVMQSLPCTFYPGRNNASNAVAIPFQQDEMLFDFGDDIFWPMMGRILKAMRTVLPKGAHRPRILGRRIGNIGSATCLILGRTAQHFLPEKGN